jgi:hypothetical protein
MAFVIDCNQESQKAKVFEGEQSYESDADDDFSIIQFKPEGNNDERDNKLWLMIKILWIAIRENAMATRDRPEITRVLTYGALGRRCQVDFTLRFASQLTLQFSPTLRPRPIP